LVASFLSLTTFLSLAALLCTFLTHSHSSTFDATYWAREGRNVPGGYYDVGNFDLETWICDLAGQNTEDDMHS